MNENKIQQGKYRWAIERKNGKALNKYNPDGTKNIYHGKDATGNLQTLDRSGGIKTWGFTDFNDKAVAIVDVPEGAIVFQRRRVMDINYFDRFHPMTETVPECVIGGRWYPKREVTKNYPEYTYSEVWLIGWRKREVDNSVTVHFKAVYPDGKVEEYDAFGVKSWLFEPEWFSEEQV